MPKQPTKKRKTMGAPYGSASGKRYSAQPRTGQTFNYVPRVPGNPMALTERKYFDTELNNKTLSLLSSGWVNTECDPAVLDNLFSPGIGTAFYQRVGRKVCLKSLRIHGYVEYPSVVNTGSASLDAPILIRIILYQDKQTNGVQSQGEDVIGSGSGNVAVAMFQNPQNFGRYRVLKDKKISLNITATNYVGTDTQMTGNLRSFNWNIRFRKPLIINFNSQNTGNVADIVDNSFHIIAGVNRQDTDAKLYYKARAVFVDN